MGVSYPEQRGIGCRPERDTVTPLLRPRGTAWGRERGVLGSGCSVRGLSRTLGCRWGDIPSLGTAILGHRARRQHRGTAGAGDEPAGEGRRGFGCPWYEREHKRHPCSGREPECHRQTALTAGSIPGQRSLVSTCCRRGRFGERGPAAVPTRGSAILPWWYLGKVLI